MIVVTVWIRGRLDVSRPRGAVGSGPAAVESAVAFGRRDRGRADVSLGWFLPPCGHANPEMPELRKSKNFSIGATFPNLSSNDKPMQENRGSSPRIFVLDVSSLRD